MRVLLAGMWVAISMSIVLEIFSSQKAVFV